MSFQSFLSFFYFFLSGIERKTPWVGNPSSWCKRYGRSRNGYPTYKLFYGDFVKKYEDLNIDWLKTSCKNIYSQINIKVNGGMTMYEGLDDDENAQCISNIFGRYLSQDTKDRAFLIAHNKLPVKQALRWCNRIRTTEFPIPNCFQTET